MPVIPTLVLVLLAPVTILLGQGAPSAQELAERAVQFAQHGDLKSAEAELKKAVALSPSDPALLTSLGGILAMEGDLEQANIYLGKAVKLNPQDSASRRNLAANQWQLGKLKEAHENLDRLIRVNSQDKVAIFLLGMVCEKERNYPRSATLLESVPEVVDQQPDGWAALANSYYHTNRREDARSVLRKLLGHSPSPRVTFIGGRVAMESKDYPTAEALFSSIRSTYSDPAAVEFQIALAQYRDDRAVQSERTLLDAAQANRSNRDSYVLLCQVLAEQGSSSRALRVATQASQAFPDSYEIVSMKASLEMKLQYFSEAVNSYGKAAKLNPKSSEIKRQLATAEWRAGMREKAISDFNQTLEEFPHDSAVPQVYGALMLEEESPATRTRAIELLKQAIALDSSSVEPRYQLANAELADGKPEQALVYLETAVKLNSKDSRLHFALSRAYRRLGRADDAAREMESYQNLKRTELPAARNDSALGTQH